MNTLTNLTTDQRNLLYVIASGSGTHLPFHGEGSAGEKDIKSAYAGFAEYPGYDACLESAVRLVDAGLAEFFHHTWLRATLEGYALISANTKHKFADIIVQLRAGIAKLNEESFKAIDASDHPGMYIAQNAFGIALDAALQAIDLMTDLDNE